MGVIKKPDLQTSRTLIEKRGTRLLALQPRGPLCLIGEVSDLEELLHGDAPALRVGDVASLG